MQHKEKAPVASRGQDDGDEADVLSHLSSHTTPFAPQAASRPATCRLCGEPVGERDYPANYPFDSECSCPSPWPGLVLADPPSPNEKWFEQQRRAA